MLNSKFILFVGRDDWQKDVILNQRLFERLRKNKITVVWEDPTGEVIYQLRKRFEKYLNWLPRIMKLLSLRGVQTLYFIVNPSKFFYFFREDRASIETRCKWLKKHLKPYQSMDEWIVLSRSSGGRVATLLADELGFKHVVCLGYPFKHPDFPDEPERYRHLATINTPLLIFQGERDEYGGIGINQKYEFSRNVELILCNTDHDFDINESMTDEIVNRVEQLINQ